MPDVQRISNSGKNIKGFTLFEIIAVLVVVGILSAVAVSSVSTMDNYKLASETAILKSHLRYAQSRAMGDSVSWGINFSGNSYTLERYDTVTTYPSLPNESSAVHTLQGGVGISILPAINPVSFDTWGVPNAGSSITLSAGSPQVITVTANTGFIP